MPLLNYTTTISVDKTLAEVQRVLVRSGAKSIRTDYSDEGVPVAINFLIKTPLGEFPYALPANLDGIFRTLDKQWQQGKVPKRYVNREQAGRIGWRIIKDWLEAQLAIIEAGMVSLDQVMLPYQIVDDGKTLFQVYQEHQGLLPAPK